MGFRPKIGKNEAADYESCVIDSNSVDFDLKNECIDGVLCRKSRQFWRGNSRV